MEPPRGIEPRLPEYKTGVLYRYHYEGIKMATCKGIKPSNHS